MTSTTSTDDLGLVTGGVTSGARSDVPGDVTGDVTTDVTPAEIPSAEPADRVRAAVLSVPGVAGLHGGAFGEVGTYLPGRRVAGVRLHDDGADVHVSVTMGSDVRAVAAAVRDAVAPLAPGRVDVTVEDVVPVDDIDPVTTV